MAALRPGTPVELREALGWRNGYVVVKEHRDCRGAPFAYVVGDAQSGERDVRPACDVRSAEDLGAVDMGRQR